MGVDIPNTGIKPMSSALAAGLFTSEYQGSPYVCVYTHIVNTKAWCKLYIIIYYR